MAGTITYNCNAIIFTLGGYVLEGGGESDVITVTMDTTSWTKRVGANKEVARSRTNNAGGQFALTVLQTSPINGILAALLAVDEETGLGVVPAALFEPSTGATWVAAEAWIQGYPEVGLNREVAEVQWVIESGSIVRPPIDGALSAGDVFGSLIGL